MSEKRNNDLIINDKRLPNRPYLLRVLGQSRTYREFAVKIGVVDRTEPGWQEKASRRGAAIARKVLQDINIKEELQQDMHFIANIKQRLLDFVSTNVKALPPPKFKEVRFAVETALKLGIGGGYAPLRRQNLNLNIHTHLKNAKKYKELSAEFKENLKNLILNKKGEQEN